MSDQLIVIPSSQLEQIIKDSVRSELSIFFQSQQTKSEEKPVVYRNREYVKNLLHTSYPTLNKYSKEGLLNPVYFGRRVLYNDEELNLALPRIKALMKSKTK